jgi:hypothetical protein
VTWWAELMQWWRSLPRIEEELSIVVGKVFPLKDTPRRRKEPTEIVIHESVVRGRDGTERVLGRRGLSVEYTVDRDGSVHQHVKDVKKRRCQHAGGKHNRRSVAIEVCNRYYGYAAAKGEQVIKVRWAHKKKNKPRTYIVPTAAQLEAVWRLVCYLDTIFETGLRSFPGAKGDTFRWGRDEDVASAVGVKAHHRWAHADGLFIEHYCACRDRGLSASDWRHGHPQPGGHRRLPRNRFGLHLERRREHVGATPSGRAAGRVGLTASGPCQGSGVAL